jgi:hypothetical protein
VPVEIKVASEMSNEDSLNVRYQLIRIDCPDAETTIERKITRISKPFQSKKLRLYPGKKQCDYKVRIILRQTLEYEVNDDTFIDLVVQKKENQTV